MALHQNSSMGDRFYGLFQLNVLCSCSPRVAGLRPLVQSHDIAAPWRYKATCHICSGTEARAAKRTRILRVVLQVTVTKSGLLVTPPPERVRIPHPLTYGAGSEIPPNSIGLDSLERKTLIQNKSLSPLIDVQPAGQVPTLTPSLKVIPCQWGVLVKSC